MYCPNCGVEIHAEGSFCAKCRKNVAYLTQKEAESAPENASETAPESPPPPAGGAADDAAAAAEPEAPPAAKPQPAPKKGFYCNYCGTFVFPEDNFCYQCGKKTRKKYYRSGGSGKGSFSLFGKKSS